ncbi:MAG: hypothetical protein ACKVOK_05415 [Flavobacteriales bacterium]
MQNSYYKYPAFFSLLMATLFVSCVRPLKDVEDYYPEVEVVSYTPNIDGSITITGRIVSTGHTEIEYAGMSITSTGTPTGSENQQLGNLSGDTFSVTYDGVEDEDGSYFELDPDHTYFVRAFAANDDGYAISETFTIDPWEIPTIDAPCTPPLNTYNVGSGNVSAFASGPTMSAGQYQYSLTSLNGDVMFTMNQPIHAGFYTTSTEGGFIANDEVMISYTNFNYYVISAGSTVYVNETSDNVFEVTVCAAPFNLGGLSTSFTTRFVVD